MSRLLDKLSLPQADPAEFSPPLIRLQDSPPSPLGRRVLYVLLGLLVGLLIWSVLGRLDIVAVAEGKLVPHSYVKIVQPAEAGIVREILVREGQAVRAGEVLMRMDAQLSEADRRALEAAFHRETVTLGRTRNCGRQSLSQQAARWVGRCRSTRVASMSRKPRIAFVGGSSGLVRWSGTP